MLDLQLFAEGDVPATSNPAEVAETAPETEPKAEPAEVDIDAKIADAMAKMQAKMESDYKKRLADATAAAKKEAQRLEKMSEDERQKAEIESMRKEIETEKLNLEREKIKYEATKVLAQRNLPVEFTEYLIADDNESTLERITTFEKKYKKAIEDAVNDRLKGKAPVVSSGKGVQELGNSKVSSVFLDVIKRNQIAR